MNMHDALTCLFYTLAVLATGLAFWFVADGLGRLGYRPRTRITHKKIRAFYDQEQQR